MTFLVKGINEDGVGDYGRELTPGEAQRIEEVLVRIYLIVVTSSVWKLIC